MTSAQEEASRLYALAKSYNLEEMETIPLILEILGEAIDSSPDIWEAYMTRVAVYSHLITIRYYNIGNMRDLSKEELLDDIAENYYNLACDDIDFLKRHQENAYAQLCWINAVLSLDVSRVYKYNKYSNGFYTHIKNAKEKARNFINGTSINAIMHINKENLIYEERAKDTIQLCKKSIAFFDNLCN